MKISMRFDKHDIQKLLRMQKPTGKDLQKINDSALNKIAEDFRVRVKNEQLNVSDHTIKDLADMGHPYARKRKGTQHQKEGFRSNLKTRKTGGSKSLGHRLMLVHRHSASDAKTQTNYQLQQSIVKEIIHSGNKTQVLVGVRENDDAERYAFYVHDGTYKMIPRPFLKIQFQKDMDKMIDDGLYRMKFAVLDYVQEQLK